MKAYIALAVFLVVFAAVLVGGSIRLYRNFGDVDVGASWLAIIFTLAAAGALIAFFLWLGRRSRNRSSDGR